MADRFFVFDLRKSNRLFFYGTLYIIVLSSIKKNKKQAFNFLLLGNYVFSI